MAFLRILNLAPKIFLKFQYRYSHLFTWGQQIPVDLCCRRGLSNFGITKPHSHANFEGMRFLLLAFLLCLLLTIGCVNNGVAPYYYNYAVVFWPFDGSGSIADGTSIVPFIGPSGTATNANGTGMAFVPGYVNQAIFFDGIDDSISIPNNPLLKPLLPISISAWVNLASAATNMTVLATDKWSSTSVYCGVYFGVTTVGISVQIGDCGGTGSTHRLSYGATTPLQVGNWYQVTVVIQSPSNLTFYLNGVNVAITSTSGTGTGLTYSSWFSSIGADNFGDHFNGKIDELAFWQVALTAQNVATIVNRN